MARLAVSEQATDTLQADILLLEQEKTQFYNKTEDDLKVLEAEWKEKLSESQKQVVYLQRIITRKVASLKGSLERIMESEATVALLTEDRSRLSVLSNMRLNEVLIERSLVASLRIELETAYVTDIPVPETLDHLANSVEHLVACTTGKGSHLKTKVKVICELMLSTMFDGKCRAYLLHKAKGVIQRKNPYRSAMNIARTIDLSGSLLNLSGFNALRKGVEGDEKGLIRRNGGWLTSKYHVMKAMSAVSTAAQAVIPYSALEQAQLEDGIDGVQFDYGKLLAYLLRLYKLDDVARDPNQPPVQFSITLDGADLSRNITHVTAGIKINDPRAIDPVSGIPIGMEDSAKVQSRELCFPAKILISKDTKTLYDKYFADFFAFFREANESGFGEFARPFSISSPQDLSSHWKCTKKGGACKRKIEFCHLCACRSNECHVPRQFQCERCVRDGRQECYHWVVGDPVTLARVQSSLEGMRGTHAFLNDATVLPRLRLHLDHHQLFQTRDMSNVNYLPLTSAERRQFSEDFLNHDLGVLQLSLMGGMDERRERIASVLRTYQKAQAMADTLAAGNYAGAYITIRQAVPCILHLENRCGEKFIKMILLEGFDDLPTDSLKKTFMKDFEEIINTQVLGTHARRANWRLATGKDKDNRECIVDQTLPNTHVRKFLAHFDAIADHCIVDLERRGDWNATIHMWNDVMEYARKREDFDDAAVDQFQTRADDWFAHWVLLAGRDGLTNYTHMVGSGHLAFYMREWGNLYRYSQQGWESMNSLIKSVYFRRTQRGGHGGRPGEPNSRVSPIARWMQRKLFFLSGDYLALDAGDGFVGFNDDDDYY
jgi:hypothetical protein